VVYFFYHRVLILAFLFHVFPVRLLPFVGCLPCGSRSGLTLSVALPVLISGSSSSGRAPIRQVLLQFVRCVLSFAACGLHYSFLLRVCHSAPQYTDCMALLHVSMGAFGTLQLLFFVRLCCSRLYLPAAVVVR